MQSTVPAFTEEEYGRVYVLLASKVAHMLGRKLEEEDWTGVYCAAKGIPHQGWSNLNLDMIYEGLGVEHKMMMKDSAETILALCGTALMHPSATRAIRIESTNVDPNVVMRSVFEQYREYLEKREAKIRESNPEVEPDFRSGWLIWQRSLREFLYFEYEAIAPNSDDYRAEWMVTSNRRGARRESKRLWIYHRETGQKRYSVTTDAGIKIQPYFDIPPLGDPNLYHFVVQGEPIDTGHIRLWLTGSTTRELKLFIREIDDPDSLSRAILEAVSGYEGTERVNALIGEDAHAVILSVEAYDALASTFPEAVSDEHRMQLLIAYLRGSRQ